MSVKSSFRLTNRDFNILIDIATCGLVNYNMLLTHFNSNKSCYKRIEHLIKHQFISYIYHYDGTKILFITTNTMLLLKDYNSIDYSIPTTEQIVHKLMRSYLYFSVNKYNVSNFKNEVGVNIKDLKIIFDASFELNNQLYFVEVHNEQNISKLRERLNQCLILANTIKFNLIIYCKNKDSVNNLLQKMNSNGFDSYVNFNLFIFNFKEEIIL